MSNTILRLFSQDSGFNWGVGLVGKFFRRDSLKLYVFLAIIFATAIPILISGYIMTKQAENALLEEKRSKLMGAARMLEQHLVADYDTILREQGLEHAGREEQIQGLNRALAEYTDVVARANPGIGVGYYSKDLDAILTYGPSDQYGYTVGVSIAGDHPGRKAMATGMAMVEVGPLVRGPIMNAMLPIIRNGEVIGYIWSNELLIDIQQQIAAMVRKVYQSVTAGIALGLVVALLMAAKIGSEVSRIKKGLQRLRHDLYHQLPISFGELGEITEEVNLLSQKLVTARTYNEYILDSISGGIVTTDKEGCVTTFNRAAEKITSLVAVDVMGRQFKEVFSPEGEIYQIWSATSSSGQPCLGREILCAGDNTMHLLLSSSVLLKNKQPIGTILVLRDLTEMRKLEEQVRRADRLAALGELAAGVAHEIRNPLTSVKGYAQFLGEDLQPGDSRQDYLATIVQEVDRANRIIEELLRFARPTTPYFRYVNLEEELEQTLVLARQIHCKHIQILRDYHPVPPILADSEQLKQVFLNLLINVAQAMDDSGGMIRVSTGYMPEKRTVVLTVDDTGPGILPEYVDRLFDPFFTTKEKGTGLGLAIAHQIVCLHGGSIEVENRPGRGATFHVYLPEGGERDDGWRQKEHPGGR